MNSLYFYLYYARLNEIKVFRNIQWIQSWNTKRDSDATLPGLKGNSGPKKGRNVQKHTLKQYIYTTILMNSTVKLNTKYNSFLLITTFLKNCWIFLVLIHDFFFSNFYCTHVFFICQKSAETYVKFLFFPHTFYFFINCWQYKKEILFP